jgi:hypothetical protein
MRISQNSVLAICAMLSAITLALVTLVSERVQAYERECIVANEECVEYFDDVTQTVHPGCGFDNCGFPCPSTAASCCYVECEASGHGPEWCIIDPPSWC